MNIGERNPVGTGNQPKQSDAVRPRIAHCQRDSEKASPSRKAGHEKNALVAEWRALPANTSGYGGWNGFPQTGTLENEASVHAYARQRGSNPRAHHPHTLQAPNALAQADAACGVSPGAECYAEADGGKDE